MIEKGAIDEIKALSSHPHFSKDMPLMNALGAKPLLSYLHNQSSLEEAIAQSKLDTRHYIKRQFTFFNHQFPNAHVFNTPHTHDTQSNILHLIQDLIKQGKD